ncbi:MAG: hypothetical protein HQM09_20680 [Candidatus Riflebacteria bacterium]|nr:hypothetical protein [Candidatus Riflebacteria bacterium]
MARRNKSDSNARKPRRSRATLELIQIYAPFLTQDPDTASPNTLIESTIDGYFRASGIDDPDWIEPKNSRLVLEAPCDPKQPSGPTMRDVYTQEIMEIGKLPITIPFLRETLRNALIMIGIATDTSCRPTIEFQNWLSEVLECRRFTVKDWAEPGRTDVKPYPYLPGYTKRTDDQKKFDGIFAVFRMGLVDAIVNAFTTTALVSRSNGSYYLGICRECKLLFMKDRPNQYYHPRSLCKQRYLSNKKNSKRKNVHTDEARAKMRAAAIERWKATKEEKLRQHAGSDDPICS